MPDLMPINCDANAHKTPIWAKRIWAKSSVTLIFDDFIWPTQSAMGQIVGQMRGHSPWPVRSFGFPPVAGRSHPQESRTIHKPSITQRHDTTIQPPNPLESNRFLTGARLGPPSINAHPTSINVHRVCVAEAQSPANPPFSMHRHSGAMCNSGANPVHMILPTFDRA